MYNYFMKPKLDVELIRDIIHNVKDVNLKSITDIVAFKISEGPGEMESEEILNLAEKMTAEYVSGNFTTLDEFQESLGEGVKGIQSFADNVFNYYSDKDHLSFDVVASSISSKKDIALKTITDLVAYKISQNGENKDPDLNFISAQTFVAEYVSKNFKNENELEAKLAKLGKGMKGLSAFAELVYNHFVNKNK